MSPVRTSPPEMLFGKIDYSAHAFCCGLRGNFVRRHHATRGQTPVGQPAFHTWRAGTEGASAAQPKLSGSSSSWTAGRGSIQRAISRAAWRGTVPLAVHRHGAGWCKGAAGGAGGLEHKEDSAAAEPGGNVFSEPIDSSDTAMGPHTGICKTSGAGIPAAARRGRYGIKTAQGLLGQAVVRHPHCSMIPA